MNEASEPPYVIWHSLRHQDARRPSAVGYNRSLIHIRRATGAAYHVLCGREIMLCDRVPKEEDFQKRKKCQRCEAMWQAGKR